MRVLSFLQALVRFTNLYVIPAAIYSDNVRAFLGGDRLFKRLVLCRDFQQKFGPCRIKFCPIPLFSSWLRGFRGKKVSKLSKPVSTKGLADVEIDYPTLLTIISDIQRVVNNRPFTYRESAG